MREVPVELLVIGAGPAGLAAALSAAKEGCKDIILVDRLNEPGGILPQCIHNGFGLRFFKQELTGPEYAQRFINFLAAYPQVKIKTGTMVIELTRDRLAYTLSSREGLCCYRAQAVILSMGCRERPRGAVNIPGTRPAGIYTAGTIQRLMNIEGYLPGREAVILGSGDIGLIMARRLTLEGVKVRAVLELLPYSTGLTRNIVQCLDDYDIPLYLKHTVTEIYGEKRLAGIKAAPVDDQLQPIKDKVFALNCDTLVLSVGLIPENELSSTAEVTLDPATNGPVVNSLYQTTVPGIFACGNVVHVHDLVDDVSEEGRIAGRAAAAFIREKITPRTGVSVKPGRNIRSVVPQKVLAGETTLYIRAKFPEKDLFLQVGSDRVKQRVVTPGETIRHTINDDKFAKNVPHIAVSLEKGGENHA